MPKVSNKPSPWPLAFFPGNFSPKHLSNSSQLVVFDLARNVPIKLKHYFICKPVILLEPVAVNVNFASKEVKSVFCHPHLSFLPKPLFTTVNLVRPVTAYNVTKSVNSARLIRRVFPTVHCTTSIPRYFSHRRHQNAASFHCVISVRMRSYYDPYSVRMRENMNENNSEYRQLLRNVSFAIIKFAFFPWKKISSFYFDFEA